MCVCLWYYSVPVQWVIASVKVGDQAWTAFDAVAETVDVTAALTASRNGEAVNVAVAYKTRAHCSISLPPPSPVSNQDS